MLSVIVPNYNKGKYLKKCLMSVLDQTYKDLEIVVVDDNSNDNSHRILSKLGELDSRIRIILLSENKGVSNARNIGIKAAKGQYITMLDSDDFYWNRNKLEREMKEVIMHGGNCLAYSYRVLVDERGLPLSKIKDEHRYVSGENMLYHFLTESKANQYVQRDFIVKKDILLDVGLYNTNLSYYEDYDLLLRLLIQCPIYYTGEYGTAYRVVTDGLSHKAKVNDGLQFRAPMKIRRRYIRYIDNFSMRIKALFVFYLQSVCIELKILRRKVYIRT